MTLPHFIFVTGDYKILEIRYIGKKTNINTKYLARGRLCGHKTQGKLSVPRRPWSGK